MRVRRVGKETVCCRELCGSGKGESAVDCPTMVTTPTGRRRRGVTKNETGGGGENSLLQRVPDEGFDPKTTTNGPEARSTDFPYLAC